METYKIIGGDGVEYGPATLDELLSWIGDGRVGKDTLVWRSDTATWAPALHRVELVEALRRLYGIPANRPTATRRPVGFGPRLIGYVVDQLILGVVLSLLWPFAMKTFDLPSVPAVDFADLNSAMQAIEQWSASVAIFLLPLHCLFHVILTGRFGATPGKMLVGARIVAMDGTRIGYGIAALRWMGQRLSELLWLIGYFFVIFRPDRRALHDLMAGTQVVYKQ